MMKQVKIYQALALLIPFMVAIAASESGYRYNNRNYVYMLLYVYDIVLLLYAFCTTIYSFSRTVDLLRNRILYSLLIFITVLGLRIYVYAEVDTKNNISILRCFVMFTFIILHYFLPCSELSSVFNIYISFDSLVSILFFDEYSHESDVKLRWIALVLRPFILLILFESYKVMWVHSNNSHDIYVLNLYTKYTHPREFSSQLSKNIAAEDLIRLNNLNLVKHLNELLGTNYVIRHSFVLIESVDLIKENLAVPLDDNDIETCISIISRTVHMMDESISEESSNCVMKFKENTYTCINFMGITEDAWIKLLFLVTIIQMLFFLFIHNNESDLDGRTFLFNFDTAEYNEDIYYNMYNTNHSISIYFFLQPLLNYSEISKLLCARIYYITFNIWQTTFMIIIDKFQIIWKISTFIIALVFLAFCFIFMVQNLYLITTKFVEHSLEHLPTIQHNIFTNEKTRFNQDRRYLGEDASFYCSAMKKLTEGKQDLQWTHNGIVIHDKTSDRIHISTTYYDSCVISLLKIFLIEQNDFGNYTCTVHEYSYEYFLIINTMLWKGRRASSVFERSLLNYTNQTSENELRPSELHDKIYEIVEGTFVTFDNLAYFSFAEFDELAFRYTINDVAFQDVLKPDWLSCNLNAFILKNFKNANTFIYWQNTLDILSLQFCASSNMFGIHKLSIYRDYYNRTSGKTESIEIEYPVSFIFLPEGNDTGIRKELFINNTREFISQYLEINDQIVIPMFFGRKLRIPVYSFFNFIAILLYVVVAYYVMKVVSYVKHLYCLTLILVKNKLLFGSFSQPDRHLPGRETVHDVYISHSENDNDFTEHVILLYIEQECTDTVCYPPRDFAHEAGASLLHLYMTATKQSRQFIVVLSHSYLEDSTCYNLQLMTCILPLLADQNGEENIILLIKLEEVDLPVQISRNPRISVLDWTSCNDVQYKLRKIKRFLSI